MVRPTTRVRQMLMIVCSALGFLLYAPFAFAQYQTFTISGTVTDQFDEPLTGATVRLEGRSIGTITDINGDYSLQFSGEPGTYALIFSFVG